jgi:hypothetical protein
LRDRYERDHLITELPFVDGGADRPDHAALAQRAKAALAGGRREADATGELVVADASVFLQFGQDLQIDAVELYGVCHLVALPLASHEIPRRLAPGP